MLLLMMMMMLMMMMTTMMLMMLMMMLMMMVMMMMLRMMIMMMMMMLMMMMIFRHKLDSVHPIVASLTANPHAELCIHPDGYGSAAEAGHWPACCTVQSFEESVYPLADDKRTTA